MSRSPTALPHARGGSAPCASLPTGPEYPTFILPALTPLPGPQEGLTSDSESAHFCPPTPPSRSRPGLSLPHLEPIAIHVNDTTPGPRPQVSSVAGWARVTKPLLAPLLPAKACTGRWRRGVVAKDQMTRWGLSLDPDLRSCVSTVASDPLSPLDKVHVTGNTTRRICFLGQPAPSAPTRATEVYTPQPSSNRQFSYPRLRGQGTQLHTKGPLWSLLAPALLHEHTAEGHGEVLALQPSGGEWAGLGANPIGFESWDGLYHSYSFHPLSFSPPDWGKKKSGRA